MKEGTKEVIERELIVEEPHGKSRGEIELEAEDLLIKVIEGKKKETELYEFDEKYDANLTSLYYILLDK